MIKVIKLNLLLLLIPISLHAQTFPSLDYLDVRDPLFKQVVKEIDNYLQGKRSGSLTFFEYTTTKEISVFSVAAAFSLPVETIATLNRIPNSAEITSGITLLIPNKSGLFIAESPRNDLEYLLYSRSELIDDFTEPMLIPLSETLFRCYFLEGERFNPVEQGFFLNILFRFPVDSKRITSWYGPRSNPFSGETEFHKGIDIGVPEGSNVFASRAGIVTEAGYHTIYGNFIIIDHDEVYQTLYGHLNQILVRTGQKVEYGTLIGLSGNTGYTTGPHLHFEVRKNGEFTDPSLVLPLQLE